MQRSPLQPTTNSFEYASSNNFTSTSTTRLDGVVNRQVTSVGKSEPHHLGKERNGAGEGPESRRTPASPPPCVARPAQHKRRRSRSPAHESSSLETQTPRKRKSVSPHQTSEREQKYPKLTDHLSVSIFTKQPAVHTSSNAGRVKLRPPPPVPPPLPTYPRPTFQDFLEFASFRTPLVKPHPAFQPPRSRRQASNSPSSELSDNLDNLEACSPARPPPARPPQDRRSPRNGFPSDWNFLRPPLKDRHHLSEDEFFSSDDHDEWAEGADPHYHDIRNLNPDPNEYHLAHGAGERQDRAEATSTEVVATTKGTDPDDPRNDWFWEREFEPWEWIRQRIRYKMNVSNNGIGEQGMLPDPWGLGAMRKAEHEEEKQRDLQKGQKETKLKRRTTERYSRNRATNEVRGQGRRRREELIGGHEVARQGTNRDGGRACRKTPFTARLKDYYDIDQPFTDDSDIAQEFEEEAAVGLAALAIPLIRGERERRRRRRREGRENDDTTDEDDA